MTAPDSDLPTRSSSDASTADVDVAPSTMGARRPDRATPIYAGMRVLVNAVLGLGFRFRAYGVERVPRDGGLLMLSNHQSYLDPPILGAKLPRPMAYLAKSELFRNPVFGWGIRQLNAFPVRQGKGDVGAMKESIRLLQAGWLLNIFPEGGRTSDGELNPAQKGAGLIIRRAGVKVLPTVIDGSYDAWPKDRRLPRPHPIRVLYGEPVDLSHLKADDVRKWTDDTLARMLDDLRSGRV